MTLDEAIKHCDEKAKELRNEYEYYDHWDEDEEIRAEDCLECANEHEQLAGWLKELKAWREWKTVYADKSIIVMKKESNNGTDN